MSAGERLTVGTEVAMVRAVDDGRWEVGEIVRLTGAGAWGDPSMPCDIDGDYWILTADRRRLCVSRQDFRVLEAAEAEA